MNRKTDCFKPGKHWIAGLAAVLTLFAAGGENSANAAGNERRALGTFAGKYKGRMQNLLSREISTGNLISFVKSAKASTRIPRGKRGFSITIAAPSSIITEITLFGRITRAAAKRGGKMASYRGRFQGFSFKTGAGGTTVNGAGPFKAVARSRKGKEKLTGSIRLIEFSDPMDPNRLTGNYTGKK